MGERTCSVDDCNLPTGVRGSARGWCRRHYQRWQRWGDPLGARASVVGVAECAIAGCTEVVKARGWCVKHWTRWQRFGDPESRLRGEVRDGRRICPRCNTDKPIEAYGLERSYCKTCTAARTSEYRDDHPYVPVPGEPAECDCCGQAFLANKRRWRYCSRKCFQAYRNTANLKHYHARRARLQAAFVEAFDRLEIFERDGWTCQICLNLVDRGAKAPHHRSPSLDHIVPIARGGEHSRANAQTACLGCNVRKGVRLSA